MSAGLLVFAFAAGLIVAGYLFLAGDVRPPIPPDRDQAIRYADPSRTRGGPDQADVDHAADYAALINRFHR